MSKTKINLRPQFGGSVCSSTVLRWPLLLTFLLFSFVLPATAQQSQAIEPCTNEPPKTALKKVTGTPTKDDAKTTSSQTLVDENIPDDPDVEKLIAPYGAKVRELATVIGRLDGELKKERVGAGSLGSFVTEALRTEASRKLGRPVDVMVTNAGGLRKNTIVPGELRASDIFELSPFENGLVKLDVTGEQLLRVLASTLKGRDAQSGARIRYRMNAENNPEFVSATLLRANGNEVEIDPKKTYTLVTIDYLLSLKSGDFAILQENLGTKSLGVTVRDAIMEYVKRETAAGRSIKPSTDNRYTLIGAAAKSATEEEPR